MSQSIEIVNLDKTIGEHKILSNINLSMTDSKIYGLVGRNASGKSMLLKCIAGFTKPTAGEVRINDKVVGKDFDFYDKMGFIINQPGFMEEKTGFQNLKYLAAIRKKITKEDICKTLEMVGLDYKLKKKVCEYSLGMRQKLGLAQAIMENPDILILDEPMNALDDETVGIVRNLLLNLKKEGKLIIITSHNHEDIELLCDEVIHIKAGEIVESLD